MAAACLGVVLSMGNPPARKRPYSVRRVSIRGVRPPVKITENKGLLWGWKRMLFSAPLPQWNKPLPDDVQGEGSLEAGMRTGMRPARFMLCKR